MSQLKEIAEGCKAGWICRFHPTDWFHEVGCPHKDWSAEELLKALIIKKEFEVGQYGQPEKLQ